VDGGAYKKEYHNLIAAMKFMAVSEDIGLGVTSFQRLSDCEIGPLF